MPPKKRKSSKLNESEAKRSKMDKIEKEDLKTEFREFVKAENGKVETLLKITNSKVKIA